MAQISFRERHSGLFRLWHWCNFLIIIGLLLTVLLRKTVLSYRANAVILQQKLQELGLTIDETQAQAIAKVFRDNMWEWHLNMGLILAGLLVLRLGLEIFASSEKRVFRKILRGFEFLKAPKISKKEGLHFTFVKLGYAVFYLCLVVMVATGLSMMYKENLGLAKETVGILKEVHELLMYFFVVFIGGHLLGITYMELTTDPGLVSDMVHGGPKD